MLQSTVRDNIDRSLDSSVDLEKRRKIIKKLLKAQNAGTPSTTSRLPSEPFELAHPERVTWWIKTKQSDSTSQAEGRSVKQPTEQSKSAKAAEFENASSSDKKSKAKEQVQVEADWLLSRLEELLVLEGSTEPAQDIESRVRQILESNSSDESVQEELLETLGFSDFSLELIPKIIERRSALRSKSKKSGAQTRQIGSGVGRNDGTGKTFIKGARLGGGYLGDNAKRTLPEGTTRVWAELKRSPEMPNTVNARYEKVWVPPPPRLPIAQGEADAIPTSRFGRLSQKAFEGIPNLNRLQSRLFHAAYETSENLLVCAPTGAGKTNVAMTAIAREIDRLENPKLVKVVYVAPMKALAQEVVEKFSQRLSSLKMQVRELTGDTQLSRSEIERTQIVVTTPEKWDVITRKAGGDGTLSELVSLLIIDEVHLVGEDRGPVIEALVARTIRQVERRQQMVRIVGLSATLPNYVDVALFLRVNPERGMFFFDSSYRPVPLEQTFIGVAPPVAPSQLALAQTSATDDKNEQGKAMSSAEEKQKQKAQMKVQKLLELAYNELACQYAIESVERGNQVMVFVHTRKDTGKTARAMLELAEVKFRKGDVFGPMSRDTVTIHNNFAQRVSRSKNQEVQFLFSKGMGVHHAGMAREDRSLTEEMFLKGAISVLCCTATLAWGVNLPAHTVIVKGTQIYAPERGGLCELNSADVFQCFGRAGRPQFDTSGEAVLLTEHNQLSRYLQMLNHTLPLESKLVPSLPDALNAEIVSGTVSSLQEASAWLSYTFLYIRMLKSPTAYGVSLEERENDPHLEVQRMKLVGGAARRLSEARMIRIGVLPGGRRPTVTLGGFVPETPLGVVELGRIASHFYVHHETVESLFNERIRPNMHFAELFDAICSSKEFEQLKMREEEVVEMKRIASRACPFPPVGGSYQVPYNDDDDAGGSGKGGGDSSSFADLAASQKAYILFQAYISRYAADAFTLHSDMNYISQNAARIARALFEVAVARSWLPLALKALTVCAALERRSWWWPMQHPLRQLAPNHIGLEAVVQLEMNEKLDSSVEALDLETPETLAEKVPAYNVPRAAKVLETARMIPRCRLELIHRQPITAGLLRLIVRVVPEFTWKERLHGEMQSYYLFVDDGDQIFHHERISITKDKATEAIDLNVTVPLYPQLQLDEYYVRIESDSGWLDAGYLLTVDLNGLQIPTESSVFYTDLLDLDPLSVNALKNPMLKEQCSFSHFNPVQTQCFHVLFHRDESCIIGAPTGSGKTTLAELAMFRCLFDDSTERKTFGRSLVVYVAPMKALVSERIADWKTKFMAWGKTVVELTGDHTPSFADLERCDLIVATPEKFEVSSRFFDRSPGHFLHRVRLVVLDEIHLLGEERGASLEALLCRLKSCSRLRPHSPVRLVGLSTALANPRDLEKWFRWRPQEQIFAYNFRPAVRVVPLEVHVSGFPGQHYCPRMASMNKPIFHAIEKHSPDKPVLIFVASRRQTRLTAFDLISLCAASDDPRRYLRFGDLDAEAETAEDDALRHAIQFGITLHHAGLSKADRALSERLFVSGACQVLIATATLAWGVNLPAHLVIIKGTEYFDAAKRRYEPFPVTDVLQMMGRAGRPQFGDEKGVAVIFVHDQLKSFYIRFLYEPFPVESNLLSSQRLDAYLNAEVAAGRTTSMRTAEMFLQDTYLAVRVRQNPSFYGCASNSEKDLAKFFERLVRNAVDSLKDSQCLTIVDDATKRMSATALGTIAARFDLSPRAAFNILVSLRKLNEKKGVTSVIDEATVLEIAVRCGEFDDVPVRHKEDELNEILASELDSGAGQFRKSEMGTAACKSFLLLEAKLHDVALPIHDYATDSKQVVDVASRVLPALSEIACLARAPVQSCVEACRIATRLDERSQRRGGGGKSTSSNNTSRIKRAKRLSGSKVECVVEGPSDSRAWLLLVAENGPNDERVLGMERVSTGTFTVEMAGMDVNSSSKEEGSEEGTLSGSQLKVCLLNEQKGDFVDVQ